MILVDTSVLIDYFKGIDNDATDKLQFVLDSGIPFGINSFIYQELLQGARTEREFKELKTYLETQRFYDLKDKKTSFAEAAKIYFKCRKKGFQIGSTIDCLVAQTAVENNLLLLHNDEDFEMVSKVIKLKFF
mgnify:CR=1 FL=1